MNSSNSQKRQLELNSALNLIKLGQRSVAIRVLNRILTEEPENVNAWWLLYNAYERTNMAEARAALEHILRLQPGDRAAMLLLDKLNKRGAIRPSKRPTAPLSASGE